MAWNDDRPMSPHLQIYNLPMTAHLSILHRGTGAVLLLGLILLVGILLTLASGEQNWKILHGLLNHWLGQLVLWGFSFSLYYHMCNGIRHLYWDSGRYMEKESLQKTGLLVLGSSVFLTLATFAIAYLF